MNTSKATEAIDQDRRQLLGTAAVGIAAAGAFGLFPALVESGTDALAQPSNQGDSQGGYQSGSNPPLLDQFSGNRPSSTWAGASTPQSGRNGKR